MKYLNLILLASSVACRFSDDFYQILAKENAHKNLIASPISVEIVLSMMYIAAGGKTAKELRNTLHLAEDKEDVADSYREFFTSLQEREKSVSLHLTNRIYVNRKYRLVPDFNKLVQKSFKAKAKAINMENPINASSIVNGWVAKQTRGKITDIVAPSDMHSDLSTLLVNAIYFEGHWQHQFQVDQSNEEDFHISIDKIIPVEMMTFSGHLMAANLDDLDAKVIELPYRKSNLSMRIFLPNQIDGLMKLEEKLSGFSRVLQRTSVNVKLPKFKIKFTTQLSSVLKKLGIRDAFENSADFEGLVSGTGVKIDKIIQKAFLKVDESGSQAAAATGVHIRRKRSLDNLQPPMNFIADHQFAYVIRDHKTVFFQGHIVEPHW
ncbi:serine protease inhibitor 42Dd [Drosophila eugracilis]|uniref:serine protease inhibitor 42Dd n=1 Tax=Drosophila eugracilis TaxID=29029 RepID=UPI001BD9AB06|nr:serine protease inhibitor 42Dd [Drosophila eugracilis]